MTVQRILIVSGTHGNEINPVWAVKQFNRRENRLNYGIEYEYIIGNPIAYEKGATKEGPYSILDKIIKTGSKIAINISEKI